MPDTVLASVAGFSARRIATPRVVAAFEDNLLGDLVEPAPLRSVEDAVIARPVIARDSRIFRRRPIDTARVLNPVIIDRLRPIRIPPFVVTPALNGCPAGGEHDHTGSGDYTLVVNRAGVEGQSNWRWCNKCQGLGFGGANGGVCPRGGVHDFSQSVDYVLRNGAAPAGHQSNWRWCEKCQGLAYRGEHGAGPCPAGSAHAHDNSLDYTIAVNMPEAEGQPNWRWCNKCQGLAYGGGTTGASREELALPVASSDPIDPAGLFEAATGPERFHLPLYKLAQNIVSGSSQFAIRFANAEDGSATLTVRLDKLRPAGLPADTTELPHEVGLELGYTLTMSGGGSTRKALPFTQIGETADKQQIVAALRFAGPAERDQALAAITTSGSGCGLTVLRSVRVAAPIAAMGGRFRPVTRGFTNIVDPDPLFLALPLHPYLFDGAMPSNAGKPGLIERQIRWQDKFHTYWQDATDVTRVFYLPDAFRLARRDSPVPYTPLMAVRMVAGATPEAEPQIAFEFVATPWIDTQRLDAAQREFAKTLPPAPKPAGVADLPTPEDAIRNAVGGFLGRVLGADAGAAVTTVVGDAFGELLGLDADAEQVARIHMEPLPVDKASFWLSLPGASGGGLVERPAAQVDVRSALIASETLPLADFQTVYDALVSGTIAIMRGEVRVDFGGGASARIPFEGRFDRMNGDPFEATVVAGVAPGSFSVTLRNATESPLQVGAIDASLLAMGVEVPADASIAPALPQTIAPGGELSMQVSARAGRLDRLPAGQRAELLLNYRAVVAKPDGEAIWAAIFDAATAAASRRRVRVKLFPGMFDAPPGGTEPALAILVQFENGPTVELTPDAAEGQALLTSDIADVILRRATSAGYRYKVTIIRRASKLRHEDWQSDTSDLLIPALPED